MTVADAGATGFQKEVRSGQRFEFGKNWAAFLAVLNDRRIAEAEAALRQALQADDLRGKTFLDVGSGSGLSSLAARRLGARVVSFDYDPDSVACTQELRSRFFPQDPDWQVSRGSALDEDFVASLGKFDFVYSWGVLHHTGNMWQALANVAIPVAEDGALLVALYNDQGWKSRAWKVVKRVYCSGPLGKGAMCGLFVPLYVAQGAVQDARRMRDPRARYRTPTARGMSIVHDWFDWLGGYPFEVASVDELVAFYRKRGFEPVRMTTRTDLGNNEVLFRRAPATAPRHG